MSGFKDVVGHSEIIQYIQNAVTEDKVSHAYILNGEKGSGKKMLAGLFAQTLQCEKGGAEPCYECHSCKQAVSGNHPDIIWVTHEKPNSISVDDIRVQINGDIQVKPYNGKYKIYIVPDADMMTVQAQNALLKTIEEPPAYAVILLLTENAISLLPTICSRCVKLKLRNIKDQLVKRYLMEQLQVPDYKADVCTAFAQGNIGKAAMLAGSEHFNEIKDEEAEWYVNNEEKIFKCCGFVPLGKAALFINKIEGDYNTLLGISPGIVYNKLKELGYSFNDLNFEESLSKW